MVYQDPEHERNPSEFFEVKVAKAPRNVIRYLDVFCRADLFTALNKSVRW
jgi:hypothetical protein